MQSELTYPGLATQLYVSNEKLKARPYNRQLKYINDQLFADLNEIDKPEFRIKYEVLPHSIPA